MGRKTLETLTESMFYALMALLHQPGAARRSPTSSPPSPKTGCAWGRAPSIPSCQVRGGGPDPGDRRGGPQAHLCPHRHGPGALSGGDRPPAQLSGGRGTGGTGGAAMRNTVYKLIPVDFVDVDRFEAGRRIWPAGPVPPPPDPLPVRRLSARGARPGALPAGTPGQLLEPGESELLPESGVGVRLSCGAVVRPLPQ